MLIFFLQGLSQTIEDIGVLQALLLSSPYLPIPVISRFWEDIRKPRVERIKSYAAWNTQMFLGKEYRLASHSKYADTDWESIGDIKPDSAADFTSPAFFKWAHDYDAIEHVSLCPTLFSASPDPTKRGGNGKTSNEFKDTNKKLDP